MKTKFMASLEGAIQNWIESECEDDEIPDGFWPPNIAKLMATAAMAVLDANFDGQEYADKERG